MMVRGPHATGPYGGADRGGTGSPELTTRAVTVRGVPGRRRSSTVIVVLMLTAMTLMTLDLRGVGGDPLAQVHAGAAAVFAPVQHAVSLAVRPVTAGAGWVADQRDLHAELRELRAVAADRDRIAAERDDVRAENAQLRRLLEVRERIDLQLRAVRVLGGGSGDAGGSVLVAAGARDGLAAGMPVVDARGLVGRLALVNDAYARVELVTSPRARYTARVVVGRHTGRLSGRGDGTLRLDLDDPTAGVAQGTVVVTRAFEGSAVPGGLPIGTVSRTSGDPHGAGALEVRPAAALAALDTVLVVTTSSAPAGAAAQTRPASMVEHEQARSAYPTMATQDVS